MEKFWTEAASAYWWLSVVVVGLAVNLVSAYLKAPIDRAGSVLSRRWRLRSEKAKQRHAATVDLYRATPSLAPAERAREARYRQKEIVIYLQCCIVALFSVVFLLLNSSSKTGGVPQLALQASLLFTVFTVVLGLSVASLLSARADEIGDCLREADL